MDIGPSDVLVVVDVQNDFAPGGALPVNDATRIIAAINKLEPLFEHVVFTRDWHPSNHCSFADEPEFVDGSWPEHCLQDTPGAEFLGDLHVPVDALIVSKGTDPDREAYSGFQGTDLHERLQALGAKRLFLCGLATDYCVKETALDARKNGYEVTVMLDAGRGIDSPRGSEKAALEAMREAGVSLSDSETVLQ